FAIVELGIAVGPERTHVQAVAADVDTAAQADRALVRTIVVREEAEAALVLGGKAVRPLVGDDGAEATALAIRAPARLAAQRAMAAGLRRHHRTVQSTGENLDDTADRVGAPVR